MKNAGGQPRVHHGSPYGQLPLLRYGLLAAGSLLATAAFAIATPYALLAVGFLRHNDWNQFSNEGQAYGGIAAVIGMLALAGVAWSLILQSHEAAANRAQIDRSIHMELMLKAIEDPALLQCWGPVVKDSAAHKQHVYTTMILAYWHSLLEMGRITERQLRITAADMFSGVPGRRYWEIASPIRKEAIATYLDQRFFDILDEEYRHARLSVPDVDASGRRKLLPRSVDSHAVAGGLAFGTLCGLIFSGVIPTALRYGKGRPN